MTQENSFTITYRSTLGAITSQEYRADPFFDATAHLKKIAPPAKFSGRGRKTRPPPGGLYHGKYRRGRTCFTPEVVFRGAMSFCP